ncbi:MAG: hypothetical protein QGH82_02775, partial [Candidatus Woesearchaeota archaeon]|nr:hypothetical protein [Candidatus Woesearchaeota archaeon]
KKALKALRTQGEDFQNALRPNSWGNSAADFDHSWFKDSSEPTATCTPAYLGSNHTLCLCIFVTFLLSSSACQIAKRN